MELDIEVITIDDIKYRVMKKASGFIIAREITVKAETFKPTRYVDNGNWTLIKKVDDQHIVVTKSPKRNFEKLTKIIEGLLDE